MDKTKGKKSNPEDAVSLGGEPKSSVSPRPVGLKRDMSQATNAKGRKAII